LDSRTAAERAPSPEAIEFVRFCYRRRRVGWPELYDEMCGVAGRGLFRGWGSDELSANGIGFSLFELPALAALVGQVVAEDQERRAGPTSPEVRAVVDETASADPAPAPGAASEERQVAPPRVVVTSIPADQPSTKEIRFTRSPAPAGA
jgi:hypothetical protein